MPQLPGYNIGNALIDFSPVSNALGNYQKNALAQQQMGMDQQRLDMDKQSHALQKQNMQRQWSQQDAERAGNEAFAIHNMQGPAKGIAWQRYLKTYGDGNHTPEEMDPNTGPAIAAAHAGKYIDSMKQQMDQLEMQKMQAEIGKINRENSGLNKYGKQGAVFQDPKTGEFYSVQFSETGERKIEPLNGMTPARGVGEVDTGTGTRIIDKATGKDVREIQKNIVGSEAAKAYGKDVGETQAGLPQARMRLDMVRDGIARLKTQAEMVRDSKGLPSVVGGLYETYVPNTSEPALNAQTDLENLKTKISGTVLQSMRDMSKTGGAVGAVTEREWPRLENMLANLDTRQGIPQFKSRLNEILTYADRITQQLEAAYQADLEKVKGGAAYGIGPDGNIGKMPQQPQTRTIDMGDGFNLEVH